MPEYSSRSNDPRITGALKGMTASEYEMALEVARQPADTASGRKQRKRAENYARAFESRFQDKAFKLSGGNPISAGGPKGYKSPQKIKMNIKETKPKSSSIASKVGKTAGTVAKNVVKAGKTANKVSKKVASSLQKPARPTRQVGKAVSTKKLMSNKNLKKK